MKKEPTISKNLVGKLFLFLVFLQIVKDVFVGPFEKSDFPKEEIEDKVNNLNVIYTPQPDIYLQDITILKSVNSIVFDPRDLFEKKMLAREGIPNFLGGSPSINERYPQLCPSRFHSEDAISEIEKNLSFLSKFEISNIFYYYAALRPIGFSPQNIRCTCERCIRTVKEEFELDSPIEDIFRESLTGTSSKSYDDIYESIDDETTRGEAVYEVEQFKGEMKKVYQGLADNYISCLGKLMKKANLEVIQSILDITDASIRIIHPMMEDYSLEKNEDVKKFAKNVGFRLDILDDDRIKAIFGRSIASGGGILNEFPKHSRGIHISTPIKEDKFNQRIISYEPKSGEIFVVPDDAESLLEVLNSLSIWGDVGE